MGSRDTRGRAIATAPATLIAVLTLIVTAVSGGPLAGPEGRRPRARAISPAASGATIPTVPSSLPAERSDTERGGSRAKRRIGPKSQAKRDAWSFRQSNAA